MQRFEYRVVPAPERAGKHKGLKGAARFAATLEAAMNDLGADGWQYLRADILPQTERAGLTGTQTTYRTMLVFQRPVSEAEPQEPFDPPTAIAPPRYRTPDSAARDPEAALPDTAAAGSPAPDPPVKP